jgi:DNA-binding response OmpR family regulator
MRVLILDDNEDFARMLAMVLEAEGFAVITAANGAQALELMQRGAADVLLTDLFMPEKDGLEIICELRARHPQTRVLAMSGWDSRTGVDYLKVAREIGAAHTLRKPFDVADLLEVLRELGGRRGPMAA